MERLLFLGSLDELQRALEQPEIRCKIWVCDLPQRLKTTELMDTLLFPGQGDNEDFSGLKVSPGLNLMSNC